jgi:NADH-quinone oxidoreductase subunit H
VSILFFGGWSLFGAETIFDGTPWLAAVWKALILITKMLAYCGFALVVRWTIPRFRFDQLMSIAWKAMIPLAIANVVCVIIVKQYGWKLGWLTLASVGLFALMGWLTVKWQGSITMPKRAVRKLPPGLPAGVK